MANSPAHDIALYLATSGIGALYGTTPWAINHNGEQVQPPDTITIYDTGGDHPDTDELDIDRPTFQVRVRARVLAQGWQKSRDIRDLLILDQPIICATSRFDLIVMVNDFGSIGTDNSNRHILIANYRGRRVIEEVT
jgi:hypothetical protein